MAVERLTFPEEPTRRVEPVPTEASKLSTDKDGQLYFWDNVVQFPDAFTKSSTDTQPALSDKSNLDDFKSRRDAFENMPTQDNFRLLSLQTPTGRSSNWPVEDSADGRGYHLPSETSPTSNDIYDSQVSANIQYWRNAKRGVLSKPLELLHFSEALDRKLVNTFDLPSLPARPTIVFKGLIDDPKTPSSQVVHSERFSKLVPEADINDYRIGIGRITEYATNYATREFFIRNYPAILSEPYSATADWFTYRFLLGGTYTRMKAVELRAQESGKDFKGAVLASLFQHDFDQLNDLIADTEEMSGWRDLTDLAVDIGRHKLKKPDIGKWIGKLDVKKSEHPKSAPVKNLVISALAAGVYRNPGVTEVSGGAFFLFPITTTAICLTSLELSNHGLITHPELIPYLGPAVIESVAQSLEIPAAVVTGLLPFVAVHESIHHYSSNTEYMGLIPARFINKETTPLKNQLEPEEPEE